MIVWIWHCGPNGARAARFGNLRLLDLPQASVTTDKKFFTSSIGMRP